MENVRIFEINGVAAKSYILGSRTIKIVLEKSDSSDILGFTNSLTHDICMVNVLQDDKSSVFEQHVNSALVAHHTFQLCGVQGVYTCAFTMDIPEDVLVNAMNMMVEHIVSATIGNDS